MKKQILILAILQSFAPLAFGDDGILSSCGTRGSLDDRIKDCSKNYGNDENLPVVARVRKMKHPGSYDSAQEQFTVVLDKRNGVLFTNIKDEALFGTMWRHVDYLKFQDAAKICETKRGYPLFDKEEFGFSLVNAKWRLPSRSDFKVEVTPMNSRGWFWSSDEYTPKDEVWIFGAWGYGNYYPKSLEAAAYCISPLEESEFNP